MTFIKNFRPGERFPIILGRYAFLRGLSSTRSMLTSHSEAALTRFGQLYPELGKGLLKGLRSLAPQIKQIVFPLELIDFQNRALAVQISKDRGFLKGLVVDGVLDLRKAGIKQGTGYRDLTLEFDDYQLLRELRTSFEEENLNVIRRDPEIRSLTLYHDLWMVRILLYRVEEQKAAAVREENITLLCESRAMMVAIANYLEEFKEKFPLEGLLEVIPDEFPFGISSSGAKIADASSLLRRGNSPAADAVLLSLTSRLEEEIEILEKGRLERELHRQKTSPRNSIEESLLELAKRRYEIHFSSDGSWTIPEGSYFKVGPVEQKKITAHHVPEDKVVRREQHKLDSISERIQINANFISMLRGFAHALRFSQEIDYKEMQSGLERSFSAYKLGKVRPKFKTRLMLKLALELAKTAKLCHEEQAKKRLLRFASSMCGLAARELETLNDNLGRQLRLIAAKQKLEMKIIAQNLLRDAKLRGFSDSMANSLSSQKVMNDASFAWMLRQMTANVVQSLPDDEHAEPGIKHCRERMKRLTNLLAKVGRLNREKEKFRSAILQARKMQREQAIDLAREKLEKIKEHNAEIVKTLAEAAKEVLLIKYDLEHKYEEENPEAQDRYLKENVEVFSAIARLNARYLEIVDSEGRVIGEAHPFDVRKLKLMTRRETS